MLFRASSMSIALFILFLDIATVTFVVHASECLPKVRDKFAMRLLSVHCGRTRHEGSKVQELIKSATRTPESDHAIFDEDGNFVKAIRRHRLPNGEFVIKECKSNIHCEKKIQKELEDRYHVLTRTWNR
ncbi:hypothetical protein GcM3_06026 [Golovinomyces cichoracearum]|uniref:Uncharacterized protein n=1 Tax=Golovinomyces cichoracearum TaxID=62708 RepID=A0A420HQY5_9PEZI|nr:hypothetical protein GcM3_06026 [Golovinomyces cichoracearum]